MAEKPESFSKMRELIAFRVGEQEFCVNIMTVREIRGWTAATVLPQAPPFLRGVINLRGVADCRFRRKAWAAEFRANCTACHYRRSNRASSDWPFGRGGFGYSDDG